uniref:Uncharacterized protein n=1 Tax=Panagrolaimus davidi TaxID=227884 RepID=A0A914PII4_9BILA
MPSASEIIKSPVTPVSLGVTPTLSHDFHPDRPQWDQSTFYGRFRYFASITDPLCAFYPQSELFKAKQLLNLSREGHIPPGTTVDILIAYTTAVSGALGVAFGLKSYFAKKAASVTVQRLVPLAALAAVKAISLVAISRNIIVIPSMLLTPSIVDWIENNSAWFKRNIRYLNTPTQLGLVFVLFGCMVPVGCALFPQRNSIKVESLKQLEPETYQKLKAQNLDVVFFNKGL